MGNKAYKRMVNRKKKEGVFRKRANAKIARRQLVESIARKIERGEG